MSATVRFKPGPEPMHSISRYRAESGYARCADCRWRISPCNRNRAMQHAREHGHKVGYTVEETTVYVGKRP